jgi:hypothetical protein
MGILSMLTASVRRAVKDAVLCGITDAVQDLFGDKGQQQPQLEQATALLLPYCPDQEQKPKRKAH